MSFLDATSIHMHGSCQRGKAILARVFLSLSFIFRTPYLTRVFLGGNIPVVVGWNNALQQVGQNGGGNHVDAGTFVDVAIPGMQQTPILDISAGGTNAVCISDVNMSWGDGQRFAFSGDWFKYCNMWWYHSNINLATSDGQPYQPACGWLDSDASQGHLLAGFRVAMLELQNIPNENPWGSNDVQSFCTQTFHFSGSTPGPYLQGNLDTNAVGAGEKRDMPGLLAKNTSTNATQSSQHTRKLVISHHEGQSALDLCSSQKSRGPDFVSILEQQYCDMSSKTLYPLCSDTRKRHCFSVDHETLRMKKRRQTSDKGETVHRQYYKVENWGPV